jgi:hypothetical protein
MLDGYMVSMGEEMGWSIGGSRVRFNVIRTGRLMR